MRGKTIAVACVLAAAAGLAAADESLDTVRVSPPETISITRAVPSNDFGMDGFAHVTVHGFHLHGSEKFEVWMQALAPGASTPIHRHMSEESMTILEGSGEIFMRDIEPRISEEEWKPPVSMPFFTNDTISINQDVVHMIKNTGDSTLRYVSVISEPPISFNVYKDWETCDDTVCKDENEIVDNTESVSPTWWDRRYAAAGGYDSYMRRVRKAAKKQAEEAAKKGEL